MPAPDLPDWIHDERRRIGVRIRQLREAANWSQGDLVARSGVDRRTLQRIEGGTTDTRLSRLQCLARALGIPPSELLDADPAAADTGAAGSSGA